MYGVTEQDGGSGDASAGRLDSTAIVSNAGNDLPLPETLATPHRPIYIMSLIDCANSLVLV